MAINLTPNVYAHWKLNESSGILVSDSSVHSRDGSTINMEDGDWVIGKLNNCLRFDGINEYVDFGNIAGFERTNAFSVEGWIKLTAKGILIGKNQWVSPFRGWYVGVNPSGYLQFVLTNTWGTNQLSAYSDSVNLLDNNWHHFIITYDGSSNTVGVKFYIDGVLKTTKGNPSTLAATIQNATNCQMSGASGINEMITGLLDEVVIYDKVLSQEEVTFRWNDGAGTEDMSTPPPPYDTMICNWHKTTSVDSRTIRRFGVWTQMVTAIKNAFINFTTNGFLFLHDDNTEWKDFRVAVNTVKVPAAKNPDWVSYKGGLLLSFGNQAIEVNEEEVYFLIQLPHSIKEGSVIKPHIHWIPKSNEASKIVRWGMSYSFANIDATFPAETTIHVNAFTNNDADKHLVGYFPNISLPTMLISSILIIKLFRNSSSIDDTYTDEVYLLEFDLHIEKNTIGSREELVK